MKNLLRFWFFNYLFYLLMFLFFKLVFCFIYIPFSFSAYSGIIYHGFILDLSSSAHSTMIPTILVVFSFFTGKKFLRKALTVFAIIFILINSLIFVSDLEIYRHWGFRIDAGIFQYLATPGEAMASVNTFRLILLILAVIAVAAILAFAYYKLLVIKINDKKVSYRYLPVFLFGGALLLIPIRGGFSVQPVNTGNVYFSNDAGMNHAAENAFWKMGFSLANSKAESNPYVFFDKTEKIRFSNDSIKTEKILTENRPNIVIIILESFTAKIIGKCGGLPDVTPFFNKLSGHGILFSNFYSSGERTDKGLISILSGYPSQPDNAIMKYPEKTAKLPQLSKDLSAEGYFTAFFYGGDLNFASMNSYILQGDYDKVVSIKDFSPGASRSKWGVYDHILFEKTSGELGKMSSPFFAVCMTLSNHEPYNVPINTRKERNNETDDFLNSTSYSDLALAKFMNDCRKQPWYNNTLFILVSDHGHILPEYSAAYDKERFRIPLLFYGKVLKKGGEIREYPASQTDIAKTILDQLEINSDRYQFSSDIFNPGYDPHALYFYKNGFGMVDKKNYVIFDNISKKVIEYHGDSSKTIITEAKKMMQWTYEDFVRKEFSK